MSTTARWLRTLLTGSMLALLPAGLPSLVSEPGSAKAPTPAPGIDLVALLERMDRAASLYRREALRFSCRETLRNDDGSTLAFEYLYVIGEDGAFRDYRTRIGDRQAREIHPDSIPMKHALLRAYSWVFLFERGRSAHMRCRLLGTGQALGREAVLVGFEPMPPIHEEINDWTGTAWVEPTTGRVIRVEAKGAEDLQALHAFEAAVAAGERKPAASDRLVVRSATTDFGIEKNGMLLPSLATVQMEEHRFPPRVRRPPPPRVTSRLFQTYGNYRFFGVTAEEKQARP